MLVIYPSNIREITTKTLLKMPQKHYLKYHIIKINNILVIIHQGII